MREKIKEMLRRPGFPMDVSFAEVSCFDEKQMVELRKKIKILIDKLIYLTCMYFVSISIVSIPISTVPSYVDKR